MAQVTVPINKPKLLLVEGLDEVHLFSELLKDLHLDQEIQVFESGGKDQFGKKLNGLMVTTGWTQVRSIGIVRDADNDPKGAFNSVCSVLVAKGLPVPSKPCESMINDVHNVTILIVPGDNTPGMIETICLESVKDDPAMQCVDQYLDCLITHNRKLAKNVIPKARLRAFLASRELLELEHFENLQKYIQNQELKNPTLAALDVIKIHAFLSSRYTPDLDLGIASQKLGDRYWDFDHPVFDKIKLFLQTI
jgi:hypothetical protein